MLKSTLLSCIYAENYNYRFFEADRRFFEIGEDEEIISEPQPQRMSPSRPGLLKVSFS